MGHLLLRVLGAGVAQRRVVGVAVERVAVERHLRVERLDAAVGEDDERVDLDEHRLFGDERVVEPGQERADRAHDVVGELGLVGQAPAVEGLEAEQRVDVQAGDGVGIALRHLLDLGRRPSRGEHQQRALAARSKTIDA